MRPATSLAIVALAAALLAGCGDSSDAGTGTGGTPASGGSSAPAGASAKSCPSGPGEIAGLRATGLDCERARLLASEWSERCAAPAGSSRSSCPLGDHLCLAAATDRGLTVSCARSGQSVAFTVRRG